MNKRLISIILIALLIPTPVANAKSNKGHNYIKIIKHNPAKNKRSF